MAIAESVKPTPTKIVALDGATLNPGDNPWTAVESQGAFTVHPRTSPEETIERCLNADIILTNKTVLDKTIIASLPQLKFIAVTATGFNVVDTEFARQKSIPVSNVPIYSTESVAQHVMAGILSFVHRFQQHHDAIQDGQWARSGDFSFSLSPLQELAGKTLGIVGLGRIGTATAKLADAFGMKIVASSRRQLNPLTTPGFKWLSTEEVFAQSDFVSLHCPQTSENSGFVNRELLAKMSPSAILINTARGGLINEQDLADVLNAGQIAGAILDVVSTEPIANDNPLLTADRCLLTPHIAWATMEARKRLMQTTADNVAAFLAGNPINVVNETAPR